MKGNTGISTNPCALSAGQEAAKAAKQGMQDIKVAFVYASVAYDLEKLLEGIAQELVDVPLLGNTSFTGVITREGYVSAEEGFVGILVLAGENLTVGVAGSPKGEDCGAYVGKQLAKAAMAAAGKETSPDCIYMAASPGEEEAYMRGLSFVVGRVPCFGGSAADNSIAGEWKLYTKGGVFSDGAVVAFLYTDAPFANVFTGAYKETDKVGLITKVEGYRTLMEIDGVPAVKKYAEWTGVDADELLGGALLAATIVAPLGVKDRLGSLVAIRHPMNGNDDYSMAVGNDVVEKTAVICMEGSVDELIASVGQTMQALKEKLSGEPVAYHLVHCGGRRAGIGDRIGEVADALRAAAGDVPFLAEFTFGEYGYEADDRNTCGGLMLSFTAFGA